MMTATMARALNPVVLIMRSLIVLTILSLAACRGEPVPRDYQNAPPAMTHPPHTTSEVPATSGMGQAPPQPSTGVEGTSAPRQPVTPPATPSTTTMPDTPPVSATTT
jgi:hypothetical protein